MEQHRHKVNSRTLALSGLAVGIGLWPQPLAAWQQYYTSTGLPMRWSPAALQQPIDYSVDETGLLADGLGLAATGTAIQAAMAQWQAVQCPQWALGPGCKAIQQSTGLTFGFAGLAAPQPIGLGCAPTMVTPCTDLGPNGNQIVFVHDGAKWQYGKGVIAMTVVSAAKATGWIADADIAVNDAGYSFCLSPCPAEKIHLGAVVLHETGHFLGLDHSAQASAVMYATPPATITKTGELHLDDRAGLCAAYLPELATTTASCTSSSAAKPSKPVAVDGCTAGASPAWPGWLAALGLALMKLRRRRQCEPKMGGALATRLPR